MPSEADSGTYVGLEHLSSDTMTPATGGSKTALKGEKIRVKKGDVLFARRNPHLRRVGVAQVDGLFSAHGMALRTKNPSLLLQDFLPHFVASSIFMDRVNQIAVGSLSKTVNWKPLAKQEFALPPIEEQKRIVELLRVADEASSAQLAVVDTTQAAVEAWLREALPPQTDWPRLSQIAEEHRISWDPQRASAGEQVLHWSIPALDEVGGPLLEDASSIGSSKFRVESDALLVSRLNPRIPRVVVASGSASAVCSTEFSVLTPHESAVPLRVLRELILLPVVWGQVAALARGSTKSRERVAPRDLMSVRVPLVDALPLHEISAFLSGAAKLREGVHERLTRTRRLQASLREASLRGECRVL